MKLIKYPVIGAVVFLSMYISTPSNTEVLELGSSEVQGRKEQPEAMTFVRRAELDLSLPIAGEERVTPKIAQEIKRDIFDLEVGD